MAVRMKKHTAQNVRMVELILAPQASDSETPLYHSRHLAKFRSFAILPKRTLLSSNPYFHDLQLRPLRRKADQLA